MAEKDPSLTIHSPWLPPLETLPEWKLLTGEHVAATPGASAETDLTIEVRRTKMSIDCFTEAYAGDMSKFALLTPEQQQDLHDELHQVITNQDAYDAMCYLLLTHDSLKNQEICAAMELGREIDHDEAYALLLRSPLYKAQRSHYLPGFSLLSPQSQELVIHVAALSSNYPQTLQGEAPAATLEDIHNEQDPQVRDIDIILKKFDIFGAVGHINSEVSVTATPSTYRRMKNLDTALRDPQLTTAQARNDAFLDAEIADFLGALPAQTPEQLKELRTLARLECHLRIDSGEAFQDLVENFLAQPAVVKEILLTELSRVDRATLASYSPDIFRTITNTHNSAFALQFLAHILQEAHIADGKARRAGLTGIVTVQLDDLMRNMQRGDYNPTESAIRFQPVGNALIAAPRKPSLESIDGLPNFEDTEKLQGARIILVGEGGGSDGIQAAMMGKLLASKHGCEVAAVVSVRKKAHRVTQTGRSIGQATEEITPHTEAIGKWRFLEKAPLDGDQPDAMFVLSSLDPAVIKHDLQLLIQETGAQVIIGVDTGGDSLYSNMHPNFSAHLPTDITPDQDYIVIESLAELAAEQPHIEVLSSIVAPGVDSPRYARDMLTTIDAKQLPLSPEDIGLISQTYAQWRMDGSGSEEGRYGKTPLAWLHALRGNFGLQLLKLPRANVISTENPWRAFTTITPAMANVVLTDMQRHYGAIKREQGIAN